jgi:hypothetical protein
MALGRETPTIDPLCFPCHHGVARLDSGIQVSLSEQAPEVFPFFNVSGVPHWNLLHVL